jgi:hypothetical protein
VISRRRLFLVSIVTCCHLGVSHVEAQTFLDNANEILDQWAGRKDDTTSLLSNHDQAWTIRTTASQLFPALVLTSWFTNLNLHNGLLLETLRDEQKLTARLSVFPDDYDLRNDRFVRSSRNPAEILINAAAYADGLSRISSVIGHSPWTNRLQGIVDALFLQADVTTGYSEGPLPSNDLRVIGRVLKTLPLLSEQFDDEGYLYYARRIGDAYCVGVMPKNGGLPAERWDYDADRAKAASLILDQDGVSFIEGLISLYSAEIRESTARADVYRPTLSAMFDVLFKQGLKDNGRFYRRIQPDGRGGYSIDRKRESPHTVRILLAAHRYGQLSGNATYLERAVTELSRYTPDPDGALRDLPSLVSAMAFSRRAVTLVDSIATRVNELPQPPGDEEETTAEYLNAMLAWAWQQSAGVRAVPWRADVTVRSSVEAAGLSIALRLGTPWAGRIAPSYNRSATDILAIGFPDQFSIEPESTFEIRSSDQSGVSIFPGAMLSQGLRADLKNSYRFTLIQREPGPGAPLQGSIEN